MLMIIAIFRQHVASYHNEFAVLRFLPLVAILRGMHIFFSGIGGAGIGPLALVAQQAGYTVSGSDKQDSQYIEYLKKHGVTDIHIGQTYAQIAAVHDEHAIDWYVHSSAVAIEQPNSPEFVFCRDQHIQMSKRDGLLTQILDEKKLKLMAIAGTHGKTTTTAMAIWLLQRLDIPESHILPAKSSYTEMGRYDAASEYFVYECDEYNRNFLSFEPELSLITGIDWDHPDIYPTREEYYAAFREFLEQSDQSFIWSADLERLGMEATDTITVLDEDEPAIAAISLPGLVNRQNAWLVAQGVASITGKPIEELIAHLEKFPGVARRFEQIIPGLYSDYAHTPPKIQGALQLAHEIAGDDVVVVYEGLHNTRQHFIREELVHLFDGVKKLYIVPSYLAREDENLKLLTPEDLKMIVASDVRDRTEAVNIGKDLHEKILQAVKNDETVLCLSAGGGGSLDEWLRKEFV